MRLIAEQRIRLRDVTLPWREIRKEDTSDPRRRAPIREIWDALVAAGLSEHFQSGYTSWMIQNLNQTVTVFDGRVFTDFRVRREA